MAKPKHVFHGMHCLQHRQVSALFWINVGIGTLLALAIAGLAPAIAEGLSPDELRHVAFLALKTPGVPKEVAALT